MDPVSTVNTINTLVTSTHLVVELSKKVSKVEYLKNKWKSPIRIAVFGSSGSGKSCFLTLLQGKQYEEKSTRTIQEVKLQLPNGRHVIFYDCPGQQSYGAERTEMKKRILNGKVDGIINVVCAGYNYSSNNQLKIFDQEGKIRQQFIDENLKIEIEQLKEWAADINHSSHIKWIITLINKEDVWHGDIESILNYYNGDNYMGHLSGLKSFCKLHTVPFCSIISPFGNQPMILHIGEAEKYKRYEELINILMT